MVIVLRRVFGKVKNTDLRKGSREALFCNGNVKEFGVVFGIRICGFDIFPQRLYMIIVKQIRV